MKKLSLLIGLFAVLLALPMGVFAATPTPAAPAATTTTPTTAQLEAAYKRAKLQAQFVPTQLEQRAAMLALRAEEIAAAKAAGTDVTQQEARYNEQVTALATARTNYEKAQALLTTHDGFDANGKVTDATKAQATLEALRGLSVGGGMGGRGGDMGGEMTKGDCPDGGMGGRGGQGGRGGMGGGRGGQQPTTPSTTPTPAPSGTSS